MEYWLITTEHLEKVLFREPADFCVGMNYVAVLTWKTGLFVLAFILMSNHLHFVVYGTRAQAELFAKMFKGTYSRYVWDKYGIHEIFRRKGVRVEPVPTVGESLERAIAYVQMNSVAANICAHPTEYPWGTGRTFFQVQSTWSGVKPLAPPRGTSQVVPLGPGDLPLGAVDLPLGPVDLPLGPGDRRLSELSTRERYRLLHSKFDLPGDWVICADGYIVPASYVKVSTVESIFRTPRRMNYFLVNSQKAKLRQEAGADNMPAFRDQAILTALPDLCRSLFRKPSPAELNEDQLVELMRQIRFRFSSNVNQIARIVGLTYERAAKLLDRE